MLNILLKNNIRNKNKPNGKRKMSPLLSIITATYNSDKTLEETLISVLEQSYKNFEMIIIDGNSKDNTLKIIKKYELIFKQNSISFKWISESDTGIYNAWNKGLKLATGSWISFLGSDDVYLENALLQYAEIAKNNKYADLLYSKIRLVKEDRVIRNIDKKWQWSSFRHYMEIAHVGAFHNKNYFTKYGVFNDTYTIAGDYELLLRAKKDLKTVFLDVYTANMEDGGISNESVSIAFREAKKAKIETAGVSRIIGNLDYLYAYLKYYGGKFLRIVNLK